MSANNFLLEVDHLFVYVTEGLPGVSILQEFGLHYSNQVVRRTSQGTALTIFFFENTYLGLIWSEDKNVVEQHAAQTGIDIIARTHWQQTGASPFGVGLRSKLGTANPKRRSSRKLWGEWMRSDMSVYFSAENLSNVKDPICFAIPNYISLTSWLNCYCEKHQQLISHPLGIKKLTGTKITITGDKKLTDAVSLLESNGVVAIERGIFPFMELTFDGGAKGILDARPILPILLRY